MTAPDPTQAAVEAVWRLESARIVAGLARWVDDVGVAEELAQDALVAALEQWPRDGVPDNPGAWLMASARHRAIDRLRRRSRYERKLRELGRELDGASVMDGTSVMDEIDHVGDDLLTLMFMACHPALTTDSQVALTLRVFGGLTTQETARALLVPEPTVAQRIVRAKRSLAGVHFEPPEPPELARRLAAVLGVVYLIFNEGYAATAGDDWTRPALCEEALRLGRVLAGLAPREPEVHALVALMEIQASRLGARTAPDGTPILLLDQDRRRWDRLRIRRGLAALAAAEQLVSTVDVGPYLLQARIAACHARALTAGETDWAAIAAGYAALARRSPSPVVELNRAVAVGMAEGPARGLEIVDAVRSERALATYALLPAVRGDLLAKLGRTEEARHEFERAAQLSRNARERSIFLARAAVLG